MKVAIVHYWMLQMRGGERVIEALCELYPNADIFTHVVDVKNLTETIRSHRIQTTFIQRLPFAKKIYRHYLPLMPLALEQLDLRAYDLVISSESGPAKGVLTRPDAQHICYCHSPMRYLWDQYHTYLSSLGFLTRLAVPPLFHYLRIWDMLSAGRVDRFIANSAYVAKRIVKSYRRDATVIHPPVDVARFRADRAREDFYLAVSHFVPYKRMDLIVECFTRMNLPLVVVGGGPEYARVRRLAGPNIIFEREATDAQVADRLERCKAFVFAAEEDFGIVPVEAQAAGAPVIAFGRGGALETVIADETGIFFEDQSVVCLEAAVKRFQAMRFEAGACRMNAERFGKEQFKNDMAMFIDRGMA